MTLTTLTHNACQCTDFCLCSITVCLPKDVRHDVKLNNCQPSVNGCPIDRDTITQIEMRIYCQCCKVLLLTITDFTIAACDCFINVLENTLDSLDAGQYRYEIIITTDDPFTLLAQQGILQVQK